MVIPEDSGRVLVSRIGEAFARLRRERRTGLVTYVTAGDPDMARSAGILQALDRAAADVIEVGVPFSDPLADGPVIQRATERALAGGASLSGILDMLQHVRPSLRAPIVLFTYANPLFRMGLDAFGRPARPGGPGSPGARRAHPGRDLAADRAGLRHQPPGARAADRSMGRRSGRGLRSGHGNRPKYRRDRSHRPGRIVRSLVERRRVGAQALRPGQRPGLAREQAMSIDD